MKYDPVKNIFAKLIDQSPICRKGFYFLLELMLLRQWHVKKEIRKIMKKSDTFNFYDAGAGFCQYSDYVLNRYPQSNILAMDLKTDYMQSYKNYLDKKNIQRIEIFQGDLQEFIPYKKADLAIAIDILEHIEDDRSVIRNIYNSLNDSGYFIISTPSNMDKAAAFTAEHVRPGYAKEDLVEKVLSAGFKIKSVKYSYGFWGKIYWILGMKIPLTLSGISKAFLLLLPLYFVPILPVNLLFMLFDLHSDNKKGNGLILVAQK